jgi:hypothetical protein
MWAIEDHVDPGRATIDAHFQFPWIEITTYNIMIFSWNGVLKSYLDISKQNIHYFAVIKKNKKYFFTKQIYTHLG